MRSEIMQVIKKDGTKEPFNSQKIINAVEKSAERAMYHLTDDDKINILNFVNNATKEKNEVSINEMHVIVENALDTINSKVAKAYRDYRNYKIDFVNILDKVYQKSQALRYVGDVSNANTDSTLIATQRSLTYGQLNKELYKKFSLNTEERQAIRDGYIYIHDMKDRRDGINCCLADIGNVLKGGFECGNMWYTEPNSLDVAFDVISDVAMSMAAQQYGGYTIPEVDKILAPYAEKSYWKYRNEYAEICGLIENDNNIHIENTKSAEDYAYSKVYRDFEQGFQSWEYRFNTVGSSRGDYPFIATSFGIGTSKFERMATEAILKVRANGQGKKGFKKPVLFPKLTFLYDENLHGEGRELEYLFDIAIDCSSKCMYPDFLSLTGEGYIPSMYKKYGKVVSLMGCRASLSPWYIKGGMKPKDENDEPVFVGRFNVGRFCPII